MTKPKKKKPAAKKPSKATVAADKKAVDLAKLMSKAANAREKNNTLLAQLKRDPKLAMQVREKLCADLRRVFAIPRELLGPSASRARYRTHGHYSDRLVDYVIGDWAEFKRQAKIEPSLGIRQVRRNISKTTRAQDVMRYAERTVKPWDGAYSHLDMGQEMVTLQIGSDWHSKYVDPFALRVWREVMKMVQPDGIRYNGDLVDFPALSRHRQFPGHFAMTVQEEINVGVDIMADDREIAPDADMKLILGNHDIRLITALADSALMFCSLDSLEFNELFRLDELECGLVARSSFLNPNARMKKNDIAQNWETLPDAHGHPLWTTVHGFLAGNDAPQKHLRKFMTNGTNGHLHNRLSITGGSLATGVLQWDQTGCMSSPAAVAAGYIPGPVEALGWITSFLVVYLFPQNHEVKCDQIVIGEIARYMGKNWYITPEERLAREQMLLI